MTRRSGTIPFRIDEVNEVVSTSSPGPDPASSKKRAIFDHTDSGSGWLMPVDLVKFEERNSRYGDAVHVRIPDYIGGAMDELIQVGRKYSLFPKTRSDFIRNAVVWFTRRVLQEDPFNEEADLAIVKLQLLSWEMTKAARADAVLATQFDANLDDLRKFVSGKIADLAFDEAATHLNRFFDLVEQTRAVDPANGRAMAEKIRGDQGLMRCVGQLQVNGREVALPEVETEFRVIEGGRRAA
jgi:hypothetical protein